MTPKKRTNLRIWEIEGEGVVYDPDSGMGHVLNPTALQIWSLCDGSHTKGDIESALTEAYPDKRESIRQDVGQALAEMKDLGLLEAAL